MSAHHDPLMGRIAKVVNDELDDRNMTQAEFARAA